MEPANDDVGKGNGIMVEKVDTSVPTKNNNPYTKPLGAKCYRCGEVGHRSNECLKRKTMNIVEKDDDVVNDEVCGPNGDDNSDDYKHNKYTCMVRKLMLSPKYGDDTQCYKLFRTRCTVHGSLFDLIINSGT